MFLAADGRRPDRHGAGRPVRTAARRAATATTVTPRTLRHAFNTAAPDAEMPRRDLHEAAPHPDPRTTIRYDRARGSLDRHATSIAAAYIAGTPVIREGRDLFRPPAMAVSRKVPAVMGHRPQPQPEREPPL